MRHLLLLLLVGMAVPVMASAATVKPMSVHTQWTCPAGAYPDVTKDTPNCKASQDSPGAQALRLKAPQIETAKLIGFKTSSAELDDASKGVLNDVAQSVNADPSIIAVRVDGHADATGGADENDQLAAARAEAVKGYLEEQGVSPDRVSITSHGENAPKATNQSRSGRLINRSAVVMMVK